jgi:hypothetical protein
MITNYSMYTKKWIWYFGIWWFLEHLGHLFGTFLVTLFSAHFHEKSNY